jgi:hypothetical protein
MRSSLFFRSLGCAGSFIGLTLSVAACTSSDELDSVDQSALRSAPEKVVLYGGWDCQPATGLAAIDPDTDCARVVDASKSAGSMWFQGTCDRLLGHTVKTACQAYKPGRAPRSALAFYDDEDCSGNVVVKVAPSGVCGALDHHIAFKTFAAADGCHAVVNGDARVSCFVFREAEFR